MSLSEIEKKFSSPKQKELLQKGLAVVLKKGLLARGMDSIRSYTRLSTEGIENIPRTGPVIVIPNHSGTWGWDGMVLQNEILKKVKRIPRTMLHNFWFQNEALGDVARQLGFIPQDFKKALRILRRNKLLLLFPEAEAGPFKPSTKMYHLQSFNPGFISLAILSKASIVPCCVLGAEETHLNLGTVKWPEKLLGIKVPLPVNIIPFPAKWNLIFLPPISLEKYGRKDSRNEKFLIEAAENIRLLIQQRINKELVKRDALPILWDA